MPGPVRGTNIFLWVELCCSCNASYSIKLEPVMPQFCHFSQICVFLFFLLNIIQLCCSKIKLKYLKHPRPFVSMIFSLVSDRLRPIFSLRLKINSAHAPWKNMRICPSLWLNITQPLTGSDSKWTFLNPECTFARPGPLSPCFQCFVLIFQALGDSSAVPGVLWCACFSFDTGGFFHNIMCVHVVAYLTCRMIKKTNMHQNILNNSCDAKCKALNAKWEIT